MTDNDIKRILLEMPHGFEVDGKHFCIYQPSLAMHYINAQMVQELGLAGISQEQLFEGLLRIADKKKRLCCQLIAYNTLKRKEDVQNFDIVDGIAQFFEEKLDAEEVVALMTVCIEPQNIDDVIKYHKIDEDKDLMQRVQKAKKNETTYIFGGKSIYGALIGTACEKFHWTYDYVLWEISYANLQMLMADSITSIYLTEEERKNNFLPTANAKKVRVTAKNLEEIKKQFR